MHSINPNFIPGESGVYLVGGTVRNHMLKRPIVDYDLAVEGDPVRIAEAIAAAVNRRVVLMGKPGREVYRIVSGDATYDVSAMKGETIEEDLMQRDFTINAMAVCTSSGARIDPFGGARDLSEGVVRMVSPQSFDADPLRILRAFRFGADLGFIIDAATLAAIDRRAETIISAAAERIREEWMHIMASPRSLPLIRRMDQAGLLAVLFPEIDGLKHVDASGDDSVGLFSRTLDAYDALERLLTDNRPVLMGKHSNRELLSSSAHLGLIKHAALLLDIEPGPWASPSAAETDQGIAGAQVDTAAVSAINSRIRFSNTEDRYVSLLVRHHRIPDFLYGYKKDVDGHLDVIRFFMQTTPISPDLLTLAAARQIGRYGADAGGFLSFVKNLLQTYFSDFLPKYRAKTLITGHDLIGEFGLKPSFRFGTILHHIEEQRLAGNINGRREALELAEKLVKSQMES